MTSTTSHRAPARTDPIGLGALAGLAIGWVAGVTAALTIAPPDIAWPATTMLIGAFAGLVAGSVLGVIVNVRRENASLPPAHDDLPGWSERLSGSARSKGP